MGRDKKSPLHVHLGRAGKNKRQIVLNTNNSFFKNKKLVWSVDEEKITFRPAGIDDEKNVCTVNGNVPEHYVLCFTPVGVDVQAGDYLIDEEDSDEDLLIIYL